MSIPETYHFDKEGRVAEENPLKRWFVVLVIALVGLLGFGLGRLGNTPAPGVKIMMDQSLDQGSQGAEPAAEVRPASNPAAAVFASSKGTKYYREGCSNNISDKNKVTFASAAEAEAAGYTLAANCK